MKAFIFICLLIVIVTGVVSLREGTLALAAPVVAALIAELLLRVQDTLKVLRSVLIALISGGSAVLNLSHSHWDTTRTVLVGVIAACLLVLVSIELVGLRKRGTAAS